MSKHDHRSEPCESAETQAVADVPVGGKNIMAHGSARDSIVYAMIRDGSILDAGALRLVSEMAAESDAQAWIERVGDGAECTVVIEDGAVLDR